MSEFILDFYEGYEGAAEIQFINISNGNINKIIKIWAGFFDDIMENIAPEPTGWVSLSYYYHLHEGWYDMYEPWKISDLEPALKQFQNVRNASFRFPETLNIINSLCDLLYQAVENGEQVYILYD